MKTVFLSYSRKNQVQACALAEDMRVLGYQVWMDQELSGGQVWWAQILERVRACDVFLCTLAPESLESEACRRELAYAVALGKPILPATIADGVSPNLLPPQLASLQIIDHRASDRESVLQLVRALGNLSATPPLPDPLPTPPPAPLSYLGTLTERIGSEQPLDFQAQSGVLVDLRRALRDREFAADGLTLLTRFRHRRDLFALIAEELDELARSAPKPKAQPPLAPEPHWEALSAALGKIWRSRTSGGVLERGTAAIVGFLVGSAIGISSFLMAGGRDESIGFWLGGASALTGAITGVRRRHVFQSIAFGLGTGSILALYAATQGAGREAFWIGAIFGAPVGLLVGAAISILNQYRATKKRTIEDRSPG